MTLTHEDVFNKQFTITKFRDGYDLDEVDAFLDSVVTELRERDQERDELRAKVQKLTAELEEAKAGSTKTESQQAGKPQPGQPQMPGQTADAVKSSAMLQLALELHDKHVHEGEEARTRLISEGQSTRDKLISEAEQTSREMVREAQKKRAEELRVLGEERAHFKEKIADLRSFETEYRGTLRSYIEAQLRGLNESPEPEDAPDLQKNK